MICEFCGKEVDENKKFCPNCGAGLTVEAQAEAIKNAEAEAKMNEQFFTSANKAKIEEQKAEPSKENQQAEKKKTSPGKIILIVFLISALIVGLFSLGAHLLFSLVRREMKDFDADEFERQIEEEYDEDDIEEYFEDYFSKHFGNTFGFDIDDFKEYGKDDFNISNKNNNISGSYKGVKDFEAGKVDREKNTYASTFSGIDFQLPVGYSIYSDKKLSSLYADKYIPNGLVSNNLYLYDLYADNNINGATLYISYFNIDYFKDEYESIDEFIEEIKESNEEYEEYNYTVTFAKDAKINLDGSEYSMVAAKIVGKDGSDYYQYDFVREVNGYYMQISLFANSLDDIGEIIDVINAKG